MTDITITASNVTKGGSNTIGSGIAGAAVTAGQAVYKDSNDSNRLKPADADVEASAEAVGVALHGALTGQPLQFVEDGPCVLGSGVVAGTIYVVGTTAGAISTATSITSGDYVTVLGVGTATSTLELRLLVSGATV